MSFRCSQCNTVAWASPQRVPVATRPVNYSERTYKAADGRTIHDPGGRGHEIVAEANLCPACVPANAEVPN